MERYKSFMSPAWAFTEDEAEIPPKIWAKMQQEVAIGPAERFMAATWIDQPMSRASVFVLITDTRVVAKKLGGVRQHVFMDLTGVDRNWTGDIVLSAAGHKSDLFNFSGQPNKKLLARVFHVVNGHWTNLRQLGTSPA